MNKPKSIVITYFILRALVLIVMVLAILNRQWYNVFLCLLTLLICIALFVIYVNSCTQLLSFFSPLYLLGIFALLPMITAKRRKWQRLPTWAAVRATPPTPTVLRWLWPTRRER